MNAMVGIPNTGVDQDAPSDPIAPIASMVLAHLNDEHVDSLVFVARVLHGERHGVTAEALAVDTRGLTVRVGRADGSFVVLDVPFAVEVHDVGEVRRAAVALVARARLESDEDGITNFERQAAAMASLKTHVTTVAPRRMPSMMPRLFSIKPSCTGIFSRIVR